MEYILFALIWWAVGAIGSALTLEFYFRRDGLDIKVADIVMGGLIAITGPVALGVGIAFTVWVLISPVINADRVVFRGRVQ